MRLSELDSFVTKFKSLWITGQEAHLNVNSHGGQAWITLSVGLGSPPPTSPPSSSPPQHRPPCSSRNGPSRRRRRARRQAAREAAASENVEAAVTENSETLTTEASVYAEPKSIDSAVQVDLPLKQDQLHILDRNHQHQHVHKKYLNLL